MHLFDNPEREEHSKFVNFEMKHDLFHQAYDRISRIEHSCLGDTEDWFRLKSIRPCTDADEDTFFESLLRRRRVDPDLDEQLVCEKWTINIADVREVEYKLRFYQSKLDRFHLLVYPPTLRKWLIAFRYTLL